MKLKKLLIIVCLLLLLFLTSCSNTSSIRRMKCLREPVKLSRRLNISSYIDEDYKAFKNKMKLFSSSLSESLLKQEYIKNENLAFSPLSIELALGLAVSSSNNETRDELLNAFDIDYDTFNKYYKAYFTDSLLENEDNNGKIYSQIKTYNSIWIDDEIELKDEGLDNLLNDYYCYSFEADFNNKNKRSNDAIRQFNKEKTNGLIDQDLNISKETLFVLMNTLYLKDVWDDIGRDLPYASSEYKFKNIDGNTSSKSLLDGYYNSGKAIETDTYSAFNTSTYSGMRLYFIKPNDGVNINTLFNKEIIDYVSTSSNYIINDSEKQEKYLTKCIFPEFKADSAIDLKETLSKDFNIKNLFDPESCDFSNLSNNKVYCDDIKHIAKLDVNKTGIEGAAITMMAMCGESAHVEYEIVRETFVVDKEFIFVLTNGNIILFSGIVTNID